MKFNCDHFVLSICLILFSVHSPTTYGAQSWSFDQTSPPLHRQDQTIQQSFNTVELKFPPNQHQRIAAVQIQTYVPNNAWVESQLCTASFTQCASISNGYLYSQDFNHLSATTPLVVVHQLKRFNGTYPPVFIKTQLNIWWQ